jgi:hypothetical protein
VVYEPVFYYSTGALDGSFADDLIIGYHDDHLSILGHREVWETTDPTFEILDHEKNLNYWVQAILTPEQALPDRLQLYAGYFLARLGA